MIGATRGFLFSFYLFFLITLPTLIISLSAFNLQLGLPFLEFDSLVVYCPLDTVNFICILSGFSINIKFFVCWLIRQIPIQKLISLLQGMVWLDIIQSASNTRFKQKASILLIWPISNNQIRTRKIDTASQLIISSLSLYHFAHLMLPFWRVMHTLWYK